jgi:hypothetical protein
LEGNLVWKTLITYNHHHRVHTLQGAICTPLPFLVEIGSLNQGRGFKEVAYVPHIFSYFDKAWTSEERSPDSKTSQITLRQLCKRNTNTSTDFQERGGGKPLSVCLTASASFYVARSELLKPYTHLTQKETPANPIPSRILYPLHHTTPSIALHINARLH